MKSIQKTLKGTVLKMLISFYYPADDSLTLDNMDWSVEYYCVAKKIVSLTKEQCLREVVTEDDGSETVNYYAYVDTENTGSGKLMMRLKAYIPDSDAPGGSRLEYAEIETDVTIS